MPTPAAVPFSVEVALGLPATPGLNLEVIPLLFRGAYSVSGEFVYQLPASTGTIAPDFNTQPLAGVKALVIAYDQTPNALPIQLIINGSDEPLEISAGGFLVYVSPNPVAGITNLGITHTGAGRVRGWLLG